jgi:DNA-binding response OmpR family regulator
LPGISGIEVCRELRQHGVEAPVMMLTARTLVEQRVEGLDAGADDYLTKPFVLAELVARVRALMRRGFHQGNARLRYADLELDRHRRVAIRDKEIIPLTSKEFTLLELLLSRAPELVTRGEIVEHVWDCYFESETNLVEVFINRVRQKVDTKGSAKLIHNVRGIGYFLGHA